MMRTASIGCLAIWLSLAVLADGPKSATKADEPFRSPDDRPRVDSQQMEKLGIRIFESPRIKLFTDIEPAIAKTLPPLIDQAFVAWEEYFGKLPPAEDGSDWQINGYLMQNKTLFEKAGLLKANLLDQFHGRQIGYQFWMPDQPQDYYRRHLLLHEATHAYMLSVRNLKLPVAYLEGVAEHFGTHRLIDDKLQTRLMPSKQADFRGHGRLFLMNRDVRQRGIPELLDVQGYQNEDFQTRNETYAWAWGATLFLDQHPRTRERFRQMAKSLTDPLAWHKLELELKPDWPQIATEWTLFAADAAEGFDFERTAIDFRKGEPLTKSQRTKVRADRGWQSSGVLVEKGHRYELSATGQFTLAEKPKPWVSEADGITFRYHNSRPLGQLLATIRPLKKDEDDVREPMLDVQPLGNSSSFEAARSGTLYLRLNDHPGELTDNRGTVTVEIREAK